MAEGRGGDGGADVGGEISALRKYIMEMMHSEMEIVESIKQKEGSVATVNARVCQFKELVEQERLRYNELKRALVGDTKQLELLEEKQLVVDARHRQYQDDVVLRETEVQSLQHTYQQQRSGMINLRVQIKEARGCLEDLLALGDSFDKETQGVRVSSSASNSLAKTNAERQKLYAKMRYINEYRSQLEEESEVLRKKWEAMEPEVVKLQEEVQKLRDTLLLETKETEALCSRLRQESRGITQQNVRLQNKLKAKSKKFRTKTQEEISLLKRRIALITSAELERGHMTSEDILSTTSALSDARDTLALRENTLSNEIAVAEKAVGELSEAIAAFDRGEGRFSMAHLKNEITTRHKDMQATTKELKGKQRALVQLEADQVQLNNALNKISTQIEDLGAAQLDDKISSLATTIHDQEAQRDSLRELVRNSKKASKATQNRSQRHKRKHKSLVKAQTKLRRQNDAIKNEVEKESRELRRRETLAQVLHEGIEYGAECVHQLEENKEDLDQKQQQMELELAVQEKAWQTRCKDEEAGFKAEVASWDAKIKAVEKKLAAL